MTEEVTTTERTIERTIDLTPSEDVSKDVSNESPKGVSNGTPKWSVVMPKDKLSMDDRILLIQSTNDGFEQPHYKVTKLKNGNYRVSKKKANTPTLSQSLIQSTSKVPSEKGIHMSNEQLMFEHVLDLNRKLDALTNKHKKLKRKYKDMESDLYVNPQEVPSSKVSKDVSKEVSKDVSKEVSKDVSKDVSKEVSKEAPSSVVNESSPEIDRPTPIVRVVRGGWRAQLINSH